MIRRASVLVEVAHGGGGGTEGAREVGRETSAPARGATT